MLPSTPGACWKIGFSSASPKRPTAAPVFFIAPSKVSPIAFAAPPIPVSIAAWNVSKSILPSETILETSAEVSPSWSASSDNTGIPRPRSCSMSSPWSLPRAATELKIMPISPIPEPAIAAVSAMVVRVRAKSSPGLIPAATAVAAVDAASPKPNAVPITAWEAFAMISVMPSASCPRPFSLALALSIAVKRAMPFVNTAPPAAATVSPAPSLEAAEASPPMLIPIPPPDRGRIDSDNPSADCAALSSSAFNAGFKRACLA